MTPTMTLVEPNPTAAARLSAAAAADPDLIAAGLNPAAGPVSSRTIWGFDPVQLHSRFWASFGVQVVRQGEPSEIVKHAELFLLTDPTTLTIFKLGPLMDTLNWVNPTALFVRLHDPGSAGTASRPSSTTPASSSGSSGSTPPPAARPASCSPPTARSPSSGRPATTR